MGRPYAGSVSRLYDEALDWRAELVMRGGGELLDVRYTAAKPGANRPAHEFRVLLGGELVAQGAAAGCDSAAAKALDALRLRRGAAA